MKITISEPVAVEPVAETTPEVEAATLSVSVSDDVATSEVIG